MCTIICTLHQTILQRSNQGWDVGTCSLEGGMRNAYETKGRDHLGDLGIDGKM
jgi:hypothetical protein